MPRYAAHDSYILEELRGRYAQSGRDGRLRLLAEAYAARPLPYELAALVLSDSDPLLRRWMAKNGRDLDFRERIWGSEPETLDKSLRPADYRYPDRDLWDLLRQDPDPFVRASLHENPNYPLYEHNPYIERTFAELPHDHRLALMRNPRLASLGVAEVVLKVFDISDETFGLDAKQRAELALAYLSNSSAIDASHVRRTVGGWSGNFHDFGEERARLWALLTVFPDHEVRRHGFRYLGGKDDWKAAAYKQTREWELRYSILLNTSERDQETLKLGTLDEDDDCRHLAYEKYVEPVGQNRGIQLAGHVWAGVLDSVVLAAVVLLFSKADTTFERLVVSLLVYIHLDLTSSFAALGRMYQIAMAAADAEFRKLRRLAGEALQAEERRAEADQLANLKQALAKADIRFYIHGAFQLVMWMVVVYNLLGAIL